MAASVTYQIKGKYDNKAVKSAQSDLVDLGKSLKGLGLAAWGKLSAEIVKGLSNVVDGATESFINQNTAIKKLDASIKASQKDFNELIKAQNKLSKNNFFDGDSLANAEAMAINMGLNQKQVISVMEAAEELTAAGIMPLDQAVKSLALTYSGNTTQLAKSIPQLKELTKESLKNGSAIEIVKEKYQGMADAMANTFSGRNTQFSNSMSDFKASIGGVVESLKFMAQGNWIKPLNDVTEWLEKNRITIIKGIIALPSIFKEVFQLVGDMVKTTLSPENLKTIMINLGKIALTQIKTLCDSIIGAFNILYTQLGEMTTHFLGRSGLFKKIDSWAGAVFNNLNTKIFNWILELEESMKKLPNWMQKAIGFIENQTPIGIFKKLALDSEGNLKKWNENENWEGYTGYIGAFDSAVKDFENTFTKNFNALVPLLKDFGVDLGQMYEKNLKDFGKTVQEIIESTELPDDLVNALQKLASNSGDSNNGNGNANYPQISGEEEMMAENSFTAMIASIENVAALLDWQGTIIKEIVAVLEPVINEVLAPIVGALKIIGRTLAQLLIPAITALTPVITLLAEVFAWLYNKVIVPVGNGIITVFVTFKNAVINIVNGLISMINNLPWVNIAHLQTENADAYKLQTIDVSAFQAAGEASTSSTGSSGASSYTAARDIYVNINYDHSFVSGDALQIAVMLKEEIARAERLGY